MPFDEFLTFMFFDWNIFSMQDKKNTIHTEKKKSIFTLQLENIHYLSSLKIMTFLNFQTLSKHAYLK